MECADCHRDFPPSALYPASVDPQSAPVCYDCGPGAYGGPCECCGGPPDCGCEFAMAPTYDPDGRQTGGYVPGCATHKCYL